LQEKVNEESPKFNTSLLIQVSCDYLKSTRVTLKYIISLAHLIFFYFIYPDCINARENETSLDLIT